VSVGARKTYVVSRRTPAGTQKGRSGRAGWRGGQTPRLLYVELPYRSEANGVCCVTRVFCVLIIWAWACPAAAGCYFVTNFFFFIVLFCNVFQGESHIFDINMTQNLWRWRCSYASCCFHWFSCHYTRELWLPVWGWGLEKRRWRLFKCLWLSLYSQMY